ncbi:MAG: zinc-ribbon domain-containing protein [Defluviitaleaceae bacterium]|nr:zinc-ribbon domain-containing protein [Defluviitaleaceae bacterium]
MFCINCGNKVIENAMFCSKCGTKVATQSDSTLKEPKPIEPVATTTIEKIKAPVSTPAIPTKVSIPSNTNFIIRHLNKFWWISIVYNVLALGAFVIFTETGYDTVSGPMGTRRVPSIMPATEIRVIITHLVFILIGVALTFWLARISNPQELRTRRTYIALGFLAATIVFTILLFMEMGSL